MPREKDFIVQRRSTTLYISLPKHIAKYAEIEEGDKINFETEEYAGRIIVKLCKGNLFKRGGR